VIKHALIILMLVASSNVHAINKEDLRAAFIEASQNQKLREQLHERFSELDQSIPYYQAYFGASKTLLAEVLLNPYSKYTNFKDGTALVDRAIDADPRNPELRYLRFLIQVNSPDFLGYNENKKEDYKIIAQAITNADEKESWMVFFEGFLKNNPNTTDHL
jgi:hypothetical protein